MQNPATPKYEVHAAVSQAADITCPECSGHPTADQTVLCETCCGEFQIPNTPEVSLANLIAELRKRMITDWVFGGNLTYPKIQYVITLYLLVRPERELSERELSGEVSNPNLVRVHYGLPIRQAEKILPTPEQPMGGLRWGVLEFNKSDYPMPVAPVERNLTPEVYDEILDSVGEDDPDMDYSLEDVILREEKESEAENAANELNSGVAVAPAIEKAATPKQRGKKK